MSDRTNEIRARLDAATGGEWRRGDVRHTGFGGEGRTFAIRAYDDGMPDDNGFHFADVTHSLSNGSEEGARADAEFIVHAPADVAWLLNEVERLRAESRARSAHLTPDSHDDATGPILGPDDFPADDPARPDA